MQNATILVVEDDANILKASCKALKLEGYDVLAAKSLSAGHSLMECEAPDLIVLDVLLPDGNGLDYCEELRGKSDVPILFLSALNTSRDIVAGLQAGGDFYLPKPYDMDVFLAQVNAMLRRGKSTPHENGSLCFGELMLDTVSRCGFLNGRDLLLKPKEFALLEVLIRQNSRPINAHELYKHVWGRNAAGDVRTVWVHISALRSKLGNPKETGSPWLLCSRNNGYYLSLEESEE